ncbi:MAG TPA: hypothetical protein PKD18_14305 [Saprospiraceae bacterium]|nr:hypothetical protein [Saprospiraceae bacterium]
MFIVQKKGFSYDDNSFTEEDNPTGSIVGQFLDFEDAVQSKKEADRLAFENIFVLNLLELVDLVSDERIKDFEALKSFYHENFGDDLIFDYDNIEIPQIATEEQIDKILELSQLSFHNIVEYEDDQIPLVNKPNDLEEF